MLKAIPSPGHSASAGGGKRILLIIFNLIYCTYLGREAGEAERGEGSRSPPFASSTPFLLRFVRVCPQRTHHPHPVVVWMWFYFLSVSPPLSHPSAPTSPPPTVVSCSFLGFCTTQLVHTVYTQPAKRKPNGKHFIGRLEWLCPAASGWPWGGTGRGSGNRRWLFWSPPPLGR